MRVVAIDVPELGNRSYLVHDGKVGVVIDPSRRIQQFINTANDNGIAITAIFETHIHNDYVTGGYALAQQLDCPYYVSKHEKVSFARTQISHEQSVSFGDLKVTALASPGHTHHHLSYLVTQSGATPALFSGGSLLYGAVGRTDLISARTAEALAEAQYQTAQFFVDRLDPATELYPTHGFGSFCAAMETDHVGVSTLREQMKTNQAYTSKSKASFVRNLLKSLDDYPAYYAFMAPLNADGPLAPELTPPKRLTQAAVQRALHSGHAIIDLRSRQAFAAAHLRGTYNVELSSSLATYVGWLIGWQAPLILVAESPEEIASAQEQLSLIGREIIAGKIAASDLLKSTGQVASYHIGRFVDLAQKRTSSQLTVLDVRRKNEWQKGHVHDTLHIPLHELSLRLDELPREQAIWVYCTTGFRASIATSILSTYGLSVVLIDDIYENAYPAGLVRARKKKYVTEVASSQALLIDVRDQSEWDEGHAKGAIHIPLGKLLDGQADFLNPRQTLYLYCATGERSGMAENFLNAIGFQAHNIGGLSDWEQAGGQTEV